MKHVVGSGGDNTAAAADDDNYSMSLLDSTHT